MKERIAEYQIEKPSVREAHGKVTEFLNEADESQIYRGYKIVFHPGYSVWTNMKNYYKVYAPQGYLVGGKTTLEKAKEMIDNRIINKDDIVDESLNKNISNKDIKAVMKAAIEISNKEDLDKVISSLNMIDKKLFNHYCEVARSGKQSPAAIGKDISDDLYWMLDKSISEDTVKQGNAWVNKGKEGTHGKFKTKKAADAQRKAMFAQGHTIKESADKYNSSEEKYIDQLANSIWDLIPNDPQNDRGEFEWVMEHCLPWNDDEDYPEDISELKAKLSELTLDTLIHIGLKCEHKFGYPFIWDNEEDADPDYKYFNKLVTESKGKGMIDILGDVKDKNESCKVDGKCDVKESVGEEIDKYQEWVDYDMKHYGKVSGKTMSELRKAGLTLVKDNHGDWEVIAKSCDESCGKKKSRKKLKEALNFVKLNDEPIEIEYVEDEHDESRDFQPSFWWWNRRYYLDDFIRIHNNLWVSPVYDEYPEYIHAYESDNYHNPLYVEIVDGGDYINVYEEKESTNESCGSKKLKESDDDRPLRVCRQCLMGIESHEGKQRTKHIYIDDEDFYDDPNEYIKDSTCDWCEESGFDELWELD